MLKRKFFTTGAVFLAALLFSCGGIKQSQTEFVLGTFCTITLYDEGRPGIYKAVFDRLHEIDDRMSAYKSGSDIFLVNNAAGLEAVKVNDEVFSVIKRACHYAEISGGAFDPAVGPLTKLWNIVSENPAVPDDEEIQQILPLINWKDIELDENNKTVFLKNEGMSIDLGAIAKGYAADEAALVIKRTGVKRAIIDLGGNILTIGIKKDGTPWRIGIQNPEDSRGESAGIVRTVDKSVVTSGVYERFFESEGKRYHHIFDPKTGYPCDNGTLSATVITGFSIDADALSTAAFVLGLEKGMALIRSLDDVECIFIMDDKIIHLSGRIDFTLTNDDYRIVH